MTTIQALAASEPKADLKPFEYDAPDLGPTDVLIKVESCGLCHSDLSMLHNDWGMSEYPLVPGHEVVGTIEKMGDNIPNLKVGQRVGLGWHASSCMHCRTCMSGDHNMCSDVESTIVGRHGGFASHVKASAEWAIPIPDAIDPAKAGPLFCGGITVFNPIVQLGIKPTDRVGVVGIGGLGHMALGFLNKWGCEVTAFTSTGSKMDEAKRLGAHHCVNSRSDEEIEKQAGRFDLILSTVNVPLNWDLYINALGPRGTLHTVGAVSEPIPAPAFPLIMAQRSISGSPLGSPATTAQMLDFCARHDIAPVTETFAMSKANDALKHLEEGKARYRIVLENDLN